MSAVALGPTWLDPEQIITGLGSLALLGLVLIVFAECGLLVGFFLPGDSLLFTAGLLVASGTLHNPLWLVCVVLSVAAVLGNLCGYAIGRRVGPRLFRRPDSRLFRSEYVDKTHEFFDRHGSRAIVLARFVPIVRTFITAMAGAARMDFRTYAVYSTVGGAGWAAGVTVLGYFLGKVRFVADHIELMLIGIVLVSVVPVVLELRRTRSRRQVEGRLG